MNHANKILMRASIAAVALILCIPSVISTNHTLCYNFFLHKDHCVYSAAASNVRCPAPAKLLTKPVQQFTLPAGHSKRDNVAQLNRRYTSTKPSFPVAGGDGVCGPYDSSKDLGVCLWSGADQSNNPALKAAGWLNGAKTSNCHKKVYIQRANKPDTVKYVKVLDGCSFLATDPADGCFQIGLTIALFNAFNPSQKEIEDQLLYGNFNWDFNNLDGTSSQQAPV